MDETELINYLNGGEYSNTADPYNAGNIGSPAGTWQDSPMILPLGEWQDGYQPYVSPEFTSIENITTYPGFDQPLMYNSFNPPEDSTDISPVYQDQIPNPENLETDIEVYTSENPTEDSAPNTDQSEQPSESPHFPEGGEGEPVTEITPESEQPSDPYTPSAVDPTSVPYPFPIDYPMPDPEDVYPAPISDEPLPPSMPGPDSNWGDVPPTNPFAPENKPMPPVEQEPDDMIGPEPAFDPDVFPTPDPSQPDYKPEDIIEEQNPSYPEIEPDPDPTSPPITEPEPPIDPPYVDPGNYEDPFPNAIDPTDFMDYLPDVDEFGLPIEPPPPISDEIPDLPGPDDLLPEGEDPYAIDYPITEETVETEPWVDDTLSSPEEAPPAE